VLLLRLLPAFALIVACTPQDIGAVSRSAQFSDFPDDLFEAFKASCSDPSEEFSEAANGARECKHFLPPDTTAYLILSFDGYPQSLPQSVMRLTPTRNQQGYRVDADLYLAVPQIGGTTLKIPVESESLDRKLTELYRVTGGTPYPVTTDGV